MMTNRPGPTPPGRSPRGEEPTIECPECSREARQRADGSYRCRAGHVTRL